MVTTEQQKERRPKNPLKVSANKKKLAALAATVQKKLKIAPVAVVHDAKVKRWHSTGIQDIDDVLSGKRSKKDSALVVPGSGKGWPAGAIVEIFGPEAAAKTSVCLQTIAHAQKKGLTCAFIDAEHALDEDYARQTFGVNFDDLILYEPDDGEQAMAITKECVKAGIDIIVVDSVAAILPKMQKEGKEGLGAQARIMSSACRELTSYIRKGEGPLLIFINQIRYKIGVVFGNPEMTSGGNALKFYARVRAEVRKKGDIKKKGKIKGQPSVIGHRIRIKTVKNKVRPAYNSTLFEIRFGKGITAAKSQTPAKGEEEE